MTGIKSLYMSIADIPQPPNIFNLQFVESADGEAVAVECWSWFLRNESFPGLVPGAWIRVVPALVVDVGDDNNKTYERENRTNTCKKESEADTWRRVSG